MKALVYSFSQAYGRELALEMIPLGIESIEAFSAVQVPELLNKNKDITLLVTENTDRGYLEKIRKEFPNVHIFILVRESMKPSDLLKLGTFGIKGIVAYTENPGTVADDIIKQIISLNLRTNDKRMHLRIQPSASEKMAGAIFIKPEKRFSRGMVLDISAGGIAMRIQDPNDTDIMLVGRTYDPLLISFTGFQIKTLSTLVARRHDVAGFRFDNIEPRDMKIISEYIYTKVRGYSTAGIQS